MELKDGQGRVLRDLGDDLDALDRRRVAVDGKRDLLMGAGFSFDTAQVQLFRQI